MTASQDIKFGLTETFDCSYLLEQQERLLVAVNADFHQSLPYGLLMAQGFRRSGEQIYRPACPTCDACQSIRVLAEHFKPSLSQRRVLAKNSDISVTINQHSVDDYYPLYEKYINHVHRDGSMYPANYQQYKSFIESHITPIWFIEFSLANQLVAVAVTDVLLDGISAVYTFYEPALGKRSLGKYAILQQIQLAQKYQKQYVYLGYQIDACRKMNYKTQFKPFQRFVNNQWCEFSE